MSIGPVRAQAYDNIGSAVSIPGQATLLEATHGVQEARVCTHLLFSQQITISGFFAFILGVCCVVVGMRWVTLK